MNVNTLTFPSCVRLQGARMVRELFEMARTKKACLIFFDEIDAIGGKNSSHGPTGYHLQSSTSNGFNSDISLDKLFVFLPVCIISVSF